MSDSTTQTATPAAKLTRKQRSDAKFARAQELLDSLLKGDKREFIPSSEIHRALHGPDFSEGMFGRVKSAMGISHRRVRPAGNGTKAFYEWKNPHFKARASRSK